jgi:3',5'-cyclic AMP phosphodiesterase CpdA
MSPGNFGDLRGVSDLHVAYSENRKFVENLIPRSESDWLVVAGDVGERIEDIEWALTVLSRRFAKVIWTPGNHELWAYRSETLRGVERYKHLVGFCRALGVVTPEDPYPTWHAAGGAVRIAPLFTLYDYSFLTPGTSSREESLDAAYAAGVVCSDELFLHPDPYPSRESWCHARIALTERRLTEVSGDLPLVLVNHWPLVRNPTRLMTHQEFPQWCGTERTADWHTRFGATLVVYGHLHIPRTSHYDGVRFEEVSLGYPRERNLGAYGAEFPRLLLSGRTS